MSTNAQSELASFHQFVAVKLSENRTDLAPEDVLDMWRDEHPLVDDPDDAVSAVKEALADIEAGDEGQQFDDFEREFRRRHGLDLKS